VLTSFLFFHKYLIIDLAEELIEKKSIVWELHGVFELSSAR